MTRTLKPRWPIVFVLACATIAGYFVYLSQPIPPPEGDGVFEDLSGWIGPIRDSGYHIKFPEFDLSKPFEAQYQLSKLPNLGHDIGHKCGVYLVLIDAKNEWPHDRDHYKVGGRLSIQLSKSDIIYVMKFDGPLGSYDWGGFGNKYKLYHPKFESFFVPDRSESYTLKVSYEPAPELSGMKGYVYIAAGAKYSGSRKR